MPGKGKSRKAPSKRQRLPDPPSPQGTPKSTKKAKKAGSKKQHDLAANDGGLVRKPSKLQGQKETHGDIMTGTYIKLGDTGDRFIMKIEAAQLYNPVVSADAGGGMKISAGPRTHGTYCIFMFLCMFISDILPLLFHVSPQVLSVM